MRKLSVFLVLAVAILGFGFAGSGLKAQALNLQEIDNVFINSANEFLNDKGYTSQDINAEKQILRDLWLKELGVLYIFSVDNEQGYAIIIEQDGEFILTEFCFEQINPYANCSGEKLYAGLDTYLEFLNERYYVAGTDVEISMDVIEQLRDTAFCGSDIHTSSTQTINYTYKSTSQKNVGSFPQYIGLPSLPGSCAATAGGNVIGFYDRYYDELIPNSTAGTDLVTFYLYKEQDAQIEACITQLYNDMGANASGATVTQFKNGMTKYCQSKGRSISYTSCMSSGNLNYNTVKSQINANKPIVLFIAKFNLTSIDKNTNQDVLESYLFMINHIMVGFGYLDVTYTYANNTTQNHKYVEVSSGVLNRKVSYYNINYNTTINDAYAINIF